MIRVEAPMNTPIESTEPVRTTTPSATSERAPTKQLSSMITGPACSGSSTPPRAPPHAPRRGAKAGGAELVVAPAVELRRHLVPPRGRPGPAADHRHVVEAK